MLRSALPAAESGALSTIGSPESPAATSVGSSGTWPSSGTSAPVARESRSATCWPPPSPKSFISEPSCSCSQDMFSTTPAMR